MSYVSEQGANRYRYRSAGMDVNTITVGAKEGFTGTRLCQAYRDTSKVPPTRLG